jgi:hypothetical protein
LGISDAGQTGTRDASSQVLGVVVADTSDADHGHTDGRIPHRQDRRSSLARRRRWVLLRSGHRGAFTGNRMRL